MSATPIPHDPRWGSPPQPRLAKLIPSDLAFVVRPRTRRVAVLGFAFGLLWGVVLGLLLGARHPEHASVLVPAVIVGGTILIGGLITVTAAFGAPLFACDHEGLWMHLPGRRAPALWLPWAAVAGVRVSGSRDGNTLWVDPHPQVTAVIPRARGMRIRPALADHRMPAIVAAIRHHSAGRVHVRSSP